LVLNTQGRGATKNGEDDIVKDPIKREVERARKKDVLVVAPKAVLHKLYEKTTGLKLLNDKSSPASDASWRYCQGWFGPLRLLGA